MSPIELYLHSCTLGSSELKIVEVPEDPVFISFSKHPSEAVNLLSPLAQEISSVSLFWG
jgi:hypothetical protein